MPKNYYICPRCNYQTARKNDMQKHFKRTTLCSDNNGLLLNNDITEHVLLHHKYHLTKESKKNKTVINNNNNTINYNLYANIVNGMDVYEKINCILDHRQKKTIDFTDCLEKKFASQVERLENDKFHADDCLNLDDFYQLVNDVTQLKNDHLEEFSVLFDKVVKKFHFYRNQEWDSFLEDIGCKELIRLIKTYYFDNYENYLIRNLHSEKSIGSNRVKLLEHLEIYYQFLVAFDLMPNISDCTDQYLLDHRLVENNDYYLSERYSAVYSEQKKKLKLADKKRIKRQIVNIVRDNTIENIQKLNQTILVLLKVNKSFRAELLADQNIRSNDANSEIEPSREATCLISSIN